MMKDNYKGYICMAIVDNDLYNLNDYVTKSCDIKFIDTTDKEGKRLYFRGLSLLFLLSCRDLYPHNRVLIKHSIGKGLYCEIEGHPNLSSEELYTITRQMKSIVRENKEIKCFYWDSDDAIELFTKEERFDKAHILKYRDDALTKVYECDGYYNYFYGYMFPSTGYIKDFGIQKMAEGIVLLGPDNGVKGTVTTFKNLPKLSEVYRESEKWSKTLGVDNVVDLNRKIEDGKYSSMIQTIEAFHEKKIAQIADEIIRKNSKIILIAAPSSSGKTSFAHRLSIQLRVNGIDTMPISLDNYFVNRKDTPLDNDGNYDFESIDAIDINKFNKDLKKLINGDEIDEIKFDFIEGKRVYTGNKISIHDDQPIILEGIHALNPKLTQAIDDSMKFRVYISVLTQVNMDDHNRIPTSDLRLIRRMVRDYNFRGYNAEMTMKLWPKVREGERKYIFPYQEEADVMFNSASVYELAVLKSQAIRILDEVGEDSEYKIEAVRLKKMLQYFVSLDDYGDIGPTAIIREFIGGSRIIS